MPDTFSLMLAIGLLLLLGLGSYALWLLLATRRQQQLARHLARLHAGAANRPEQESIIKAAPAPVAEQPWWQRLPGHAWLLRILPHAGLAWQPGRFWACCGLASLPGLLGASLLHLPLAGLLLATLATAASPYGWLHLRLQRHRLRYEQQLPPALDLIARAMRAGNSLTGSFGLLAEEMPAPMGPAFRQLHDEIHFGVPLDEALRHLQAHSPIDEVRYFVVAAIVQRETGGNFTRSLASLSAMIRARILLRSKLKTMTAEGRLSALVLTLLPLMLAAGFSFINRPYMRFFWLNPVGIQCSWVALGMLLLGNVWMRALIRLRQ